MMIRKPAATVFLTLALGALSTSGAHAQAAAAAPAQLSPAAADDALLTHFENDVTRVVGKMPADKYDFTPASLNIPGANYTGVRTFAFEVKHLIQANYGLAGVLTGTAPTVDMKGIGELMTKAEIVAALADSFKTMHAAIATLTPANANDRLDDKRVGFAISRQSLGAYVCTHGYDHYGQLVEYLRMNGLSPAA